MPTDRDKLLKGIRWISVGLPFVISGPILFTAFGIPQMNQGNYMWLAISILMMLLAAFFCVKGLKTILSSFFDGPAN